MKYPVLHPRILAAFLPAMALLLIPAHAQEANQYFNGGTGVWDAGVTPDWDGTNVWSTDNTANFNNASTVTVDDSHGAVVVYQIYSNADTTIAPNTSSDTLDFLGTPNNYSVVQDNGGSLTISAPLELSDSGPDVQYFFTNQASGGVMTIGSVDFGAYSNGQTNIGRLQANTYDSTGGEVFNGTYTTSTSHGGSINFGADTGQGTYTLASTADFTNFNTGIAAGAAGNSFSFTGSVLNIETSKFSGTQTLSFYTALTGNLVNIVGAQNIDLSIYSSQKNDVEPPNAPSDGGITDVGKMIFNQSTADQSTWSGNVNQNNANVVLEAVTGGRLNWAADLTSSTPEGLTINAQNGGVVVLSSNNNNYGTGNGGGGQGPVAATLEGGTTLITNTANSAFGSGAGTVNVNAGATLGGNGFDIQTVVLAGTSSVLAPGDAGQANLGIHPSIGLLSLGNVVATNGLTMDFKLTGEGFTTTLQSGFSNVSAAGTDDDLLYIGTLSLGGTVDINLTALDALQTGGAYYLVEGSGAWTEAAGTTFDVTTPAGYALDTTYGTDGVLFDNSGDTISIQLVATPEPSTYALMGLGLLAFAGFGRWMRGMQST